jgi:hypothetical protein
VQNINDLSERGDVGGAAVVRVEAHAACGVGTVSAQAYFVSFLLISCLQEMRKFVKEMGDVEIRVAVDFIGQ